MIDNILDCWGKIPRVLRHYFAYMKLQKKLLGRYKYWTHDLDKVLMYILFPFLGLNIIKQIHRGWCRHHILTSKTVDEVDYVAAAIDWECCRFTKPNEPMNAREYLEYAYSKGKLGDLHYYNMNTVLRSIGL